MLTRSKSITLDTWSREHIQTLRSIGNNASNAIYNPNEQKNPPPTSTDSSERDSEMEKYIRRKYEVGAFKAGANPGKAAEGVNSRDRYRAAQSLGVEKGMENRRNPELNNLVFKKNSREERDLPPLPPLSASRPGSSAGGGGGARERPNPSTVPPPLETETMLINLGGATRATLPLQSQAQQASTFTQNGNGFNCQSQFIPQQPTQFQLSPQPQLQNQNGYFPQQQYTNNPFMQSQQQYPQQQFLSPSQSPSPYGPYGNGAMGTSPGGTNPFLQMNQGQQQQMGQGQGQMYAQGQAWNGSGQGQQMQNGWQGHVQGQQTQFQQPQQQYGQQQQQGWPNMGMAGMGMGYAQGH